MCDRKLFGGGEAKIEGRTAIIYPSSDVRNDWMAAVSISEVGGAVVCGLPFSPQAQGPRTTGL